MRNLRRSLCRAAGLFVICAGVGILTPGESQGAVRQAEIQTRTSYVVNVEAPSAAVFQKPGGSGAVIGQVRSGQVLEVLGYEIAGGRAGRWQSMPSGFWEGSMYMGERIPMKGWTVRDLPVMCSPKRPPLTCRIPPEARRTLEPM